MADAAPEMPVHQELPAPRKWTGPGRRDAPILLHRPAAGGSTVEHAPCDAFDDPVERQQHIAGIIDVGQHRCTTLDDGRPTKASLRDTPLHQDAVPQLRDAPIGWIDQRVAIAVVFGDETEVRVRTGVTGDRAGDEGDWRTRGLRTPCDGGREHDAHAQCGPGPSRLPLGPFAHSTLRKFTKSCFSDSV